MHSYLLRNPTKEETITLTNPTPHPLQELISWLGRSHSDNAHVAMPTSPRDRTIINLSAATNRFKGRYHVVWVTGLFFCVLNVTMTIVV